MFCDKGTSLALFVAVFVVSTVELTQGTCPSPPAPLITLQGSPPYDSYKVVKFGCSKEFSISYKLIGAPKSECQPDGTWAPKLPKCQAYQCSLNPPHVSDGWLLTPMIQGITNKIGSSVTYTCVVGFKVLPGAVSKTCQKNGHWEGNVTCVVVVCAAPTLSRGHVTYSSLSYGSIANYSCIYYGDHLTGKSTRICNKDGIWSGTTPRCTRPCLQPGNPLNGHRSRCPYSPIGNQCKIGKTVRFYCEERYRIEGSTARTCMVNGEWSGIQPKCVVNSCGPPGPFSHGSMTFNIDYFVIGTIVQFICNSGYKLIGDQTRVCQHSGHWTGVRNPTCKELFCCEPGIIKNGDHDNLHPDGHYPFGITVQYRCDTQHYLLGNATRECKAKPDTTYWSGRILMCLTLTQFDSECSERKGHFKILDGQPRCEIQVIKPTASSSHGQRELDTLTIVTASAGSTLGALVILLSVMVFVRRFHRNRRFRHHSIRSRFYSDEDHVTLIATYRGDANFSLPSYDEAMSQTQRDPPPFESVVQDSSDGPTNNNFNILAISNGPGSTSNVLTNSNTSAPALNGSSADQQINIVNNPMTVNNTAGNSSRPNDATDQGDTSRASISSQESLVSSDPSSSHDGLTLSLSEGDQSDHESQPLIH